MKAETRILNAIPIDELTGSISTPIYQTSTFVQEAPGINKGYEYARSSNPTRKVLEDLLASLEEGTAGFAFASGLAAVDAVIKLLSAGDEVLARIRREQSQYLGSRPQCSADERANRTVGA